MSFPSLLGHPHLTVEVLLCAEDHVRAPEPVRGRRRTRDPGERRLVEVLETVELRGPQDAAALLGDAAARRSRAPRASSPRRSDARSSLAQRTAYCLRALGVLEDAGHRGRAPLHRRAGAAMASR